MALSFNLKSVLIVLIALLAIAPFPTAEGALLV